jgi:hypothetical protein
VIARLLCRNRSSTLPDGVGRVPVVGTGGGKLADVPRTGRPGFSLQAIVVGVARRAVAQANLPHL